MLGFNLPDPHGRCLISSSLRSGLSNKGISVNDLNLFERFQEAPIEEWESEVGKKEANKRSCCSGYWSGQRGSETLGASVEHTSESLHQRDKIATPGLCYFLGTSNLYIRYAGRLQSPEKAQGPESTMQEVLRWACRDDMNRKMIAQ